MEATATKYTELYSTTPAPGAPIPVPLCCWWRVRNDAPQAEEIARHVRKLKTKKAPGASGIRPEDMRHWLELYKAGDNRRPFRLLTEIVQSAFLMGQLPQALSVAILVLLPKPGSGDFRGIGLLESIWKLVSSIIDSRLKGVLEFDNTIHGFRQERGTGTAVLRNKLSMQLAVRRKDTVVQIYLDLTKAYNTLDRACTLAILQGYNIGNNVIRILETFWMRHKAVPRASGYYGWVIKATRRVTQGNIVSPLIFNMVVDCILKAWKLEFAGMAAQVDAMFYADNSELLSESTTALQAALEHFSDYFANVGLWMNVDKTKLLVLDPRSNPAWHVITSLPSHKNCHGPLGTKNE